METIVKSNPDFIFSMYTEPVKFFNDHLGKFEVAAVKNRNVFYLDPDHISSYTPSDYIKSVEEISAAVKKRK
jgi:ABC-type Fe3+-hydroxamate transport system substrate-binding protein